MTGAWNRRGTFGLAGAGLLAAGLALWANGAGPWAGLAGAALLGGAIIGWWRAELPPGAPVWLRHVAALAIVLDILICGLWALLCLRTFGSDIALLPQSDPRHLSLVGTLAIVASAALARWALDVRRDRAAALWAAMALGAVAGGAELYGMGHRVPPAFGGLRLLHLVLGLAVLAAVRPAGRMALTLGVMAWMGIAGLWTILFVAAWLA